MTERSPGGPTWPQVLAMVPDVAAIATFGTLALARVMDPHTAGAFVVAIVAGRLYPRPPGGGGGGGLPPGGVATLIGALGGAARWLGHVPGAMKV